MRHIVPVVVGLVAFISPSAAMSQRDNPLVAPEVAVQSEDYAAARARFRTTLTRRSPSPQAPQPFTTASSAREVSYTSNGVDLTAWLSRAVASGAKRPAVLFLHGGFAFSVEDWEMASPFRDAGFVVMMPMLRGENGQPGEYSLFYDEVDDVLAAAAFLKRQPEIDPDRVFVAGHSAGGTLALLSSQASPTFRGAASFSGSPDQVTFVRGLRKELVPFNATDKHELIMRSPLAFASSFKSPARLYYGTEEPYFHLSSLRTASIAKKRGLDVRAIQVKGDHYSSVNGAMLQSIAFFRSLMRQPQTR